MIKSFSTAGVLIAASLLVSAHAADLEQVGTPQRNPALMKGYGVDVPVRSALRQVVPDGWELFIHKQAALPAGMSWKVDEPWPQVLARFSASSNLAVKVDWDKKAVYIRTPEIARSEAAAAAPVDKPAPVTASVQSGGGSDKNTVVLTGTTLSQAIQAIQALHRVPVSWEAPEVGNVRIPALTLRGLSVEDDLRLLLRATGLTPPVSFLVHRQGPVVRIMKASPTGEHLRVVDVPYEGVIHAAAGGTFTPPSASGKRPSLAASSPASLGAAPQPATLSPASGPLVLEVRRGEMLSKALDRFLRANGWNLVWKLGTEDDFENDGIDLRREGRTVTEVLTRLNLPAMGLRAEVFPADRVVEITNTAPLAD